MSLLNLYGIAFKCPYFDQFENPECPLKVIRELNDVSIQLEAIEQLSNERKRVLLDRHYCCTKRKAFELQKKKNQMVN